MTKWSSFPYPLNKLSIVSAPIPMPGHSALGIITLKVSKRRHLPKLRFKFRTAKWNILAIQ